MPEPDGSGPAVEEVGRAYREIDALLDRPWVMLSAGAGMEPFRRICAFAFEPGASGYLAGRALWWQALQHFPDLDAFRRELRRESSPYIAALVSGCTAPARPWTGCPAFRDGIRLAPRPGRRSFREYGT